MIEQKKHAIILRITQGKKEDENELPVIRYIVQYQRAEEDNYPRRYEIAAKPNGKPCYHDQSTKFPFLLSRPLRTWHQCRRKAKISEWVDGQKYKHPTMCFFGFRSK